MNRNELIILMKTKTSPTLAEVKMYYKTKIPPSQRPQITSPEAAVELLRSVWEEGQLELREEFLVLLLDNARQFLGWSKISAGGATATIVDPAAVLRVALVSNAQSIILSHNHPSGNLDASKADTELTNRMVEGGKMLGIEVSDHIILTSEGYTSFREKGLIT